MKRVLHEELLLEDSTLKKQCVAYFTKFKDIHGDWTYDEQKDAFVHNDQIQAYRLNGILYDEKRKPFDLTTLDIPHIGRDIWYLILCHLQSGDLIYIEYTCVRIAKVIAQIWKERGAVIAKRFGPVFYQILKFEGMTIREFYYFCTTSLWCELWLPFEILFSLPPGHAKKYIGKGGPCECAPAATKTFGVMETIDGKYAGFLKYKRQRTFRLYWNRAICVDGVNITAGFISRTMEAILNDKPIVSGISHWKI